MAVTQKQKGADVLKILKNARACAIHNQQMDPDHLYIRIFFLIIIIYLFS